MTRDDMDNVSSVILKELQRAFDEAYIVEHFSDGTLYCVVLKDGTSYQLTLHFDEE